MKNSKTSVFSNGLIWFGAAVSIAEILTGTLLAPLGFKKGLFAILIGHLIGCILFYLAGMIGAKTQKSAMETVKISFGQKGSTLFSSLNILQLVGWTAVMIVSGSTAANLIINLGNGKAWCLIIGALTVIWVFVDLKTLNRLNTIAMGLLFILTLILSTVIFRSNEATVFTESISFGSAVELSVAMPLSWLPLISDYTRNAQKPESSTLTSTIVYFVVSSWMYVIGMSATIFTGKSDIAQIMMNVGLGIAALFIIVFSTVTTIFLDVYSAGVSSNSLWSKLKEKPVAIAVCVIGTLLSIYTPITKYESFLYLIGSVFAPMITILIVDFFILKKDYSHKIFQWTNLGLWVVGFIIYRVFMHIDTPVGNTFPVILITAVLCVITHKLTGGKKNA